MKQLYLAILAGLLYAVSFPLYSIWPLAWVWAVPLLFLMKDVSAGRAFLYGMVAGVIAWSGVLYWIAYVMSTYGGMGLFPAAFLLLLLVVYMSLYFGGFVWLSRRFIHSSRAFLAIPGIWILFELLRSYFIFSGFPWALLGYSQYPWISFIQIAEIGGVYLIGGIILMGNVAIYQALRKREFVPLVISVLLVAVCASWGAWRMGNVFDKGEPVRAAVAQANIPQDQKWAPEIVNPTIDTYERFTKAAVKQGAKVVAWPETACPFFLFLDWPYTSRIISLSRSVDAKLVVGSPAYENDQYFNRMWLLENGRIGGSYDKVHLVPFGEYLPLSDLIRPFFSGLTKEVGNFTPARKPHPIGEIGVFTCFESIFPGMTRDLSNQGATYLINASNDAWFKTWSTPEQLLQITSFRAIESRKWLLRPVNHGISAIINPKGQAVRKIGLLKEDFIVADITPSGMLTFYTKFGPVIALVWAALSGIAALTFFRSGAKAS